MAKTKDTGTSDQAGSGNPPKKLTRVSKAKNNTNEVSARMIIRALKVIPLSSRKKDGAGGHSLAAIRNYVYATHGLEMTKERQAIVKSIIGQEFSRGRIQMANHDGDLNYTKRFEVAPDADENEMSDLESSSGGDDEDDEK